MPGNKKDKSKEKTQQKRDRSKVRVGINNGKMGRPRIEIDFDDLNKLCQLQCTLVEVAGFFGCSEDTIELRIKEKTGLTFPEYLKSHGSEGKRSLRRLQYLSAMKGSVPMQIWLGKQWLGQRDSHDVQAQVSKIKIDKSDEDL
jgi:hypothetical protein